MFAMASFQRPFLQLLHIIDYRLLFLVAFCSYLGIMMAAVLYNTTWGTHNSIDTQIGMTLQQLELSERSSESYIRLHERYQEGLGRQNELYNVIQTRCFVLTQKNEELLEAYGEAVGLCRELARSYSRNSELHGEMVETYKDLSRQYGLMAMNFGYALGGHAQLSAR